MDEDDNKLVSHASHRWVKKIAEKEMTCWGSKATINKDDTYYEYQFELTLYGKKIEMERPVVTKREYFKHALQGRPGFKYYDKE